MHSGRPGAFQCAGPVRRTHARTLASWHSMASDAAGNWWQVGCMRAAMIAIVMTTSDTEQQNSKKALCVPALEHSSIEPATTRRATWPPRRACTPAALTRLPAPSQCIVHRYSSAHGTAHLLIAGRRRCWCAHGVVGGGAPACTRRRRTPRAHCQGMCTVDRRAQPLPATAEFVSTNRSQFLLRAS